MSTANLVELNRAKTVLAKKIQLPESTYDIAIARRVGTYGLLLVIYIPVDNALLNRIPDRVNGFEVDLIVDSRS